MTKIVRGMDPRIRIRIHTKMSWIRNIVSQQCSVNNYSLPRGWRGGWRGGKLFSFRGFAIFMQSEFEFKKNHVYIFHLHRYTHGLYYIYNRRQSKMSSSKNIGLSHICIFDPALGELLPLSPSLWFNSPLPPPFPVWIRISILYTRIQCVRGRGYKGFWASDRQTPAAKSLYR